ncbi:autophagy protein Apg5-domain-containing protein [Syncephalis fuscata]|nr:autophagy protein Apg5-domain-containing protein [Syncephalis fuscata]
MMSSAETSAIPYSIWSGVIPAQFELDASELDAAGMVDTTAEPCFMLLRRCNYLTVTTPLVRELLVQRNLPFIGEDSDIWYSCNNRPLRWHYPIGLLYDLEVHHSLVAKQKGINTDEIWRITVHTRNYPKDSLKMAIPSLKTMQDIYMSMLKESDVLRNGPLKKVMRLPKQEQAALWESLTEVNEKLVSVKGPSQPPSTPIKTSFESDPASTVETAVLNEAADGSSKEVSSIRFVPLRVYLPDCPIVQEPILAIGSKGEERSLGDALHDLLPTLFPIASMQKSGSTDATASSENSSDDSGENSSTNDDSSENIDNEQMKKSLASDVAIASLPSLYAVLHGIVIPLETPLIWAVQHLVYADNFLHVVIHLPDN